MTEKRFLLVKCVYENWGLIDKSLEDIDQLVLMHTSKSSVRYLVNLLNQLNDENEQLKKVAKEFVQNRTQHNFWKLRTVLRDSGVE